MNPEAASAEELHYEYVQLYLDDFKDLLVADAGLQDQETRSSFSYLLQPRSLGMTVFKALKLRPVALENKLPNLFPANLLPANLLPANLLPATVNEVSVHRFYANRT